MYVKASIGQLGQYTRAFEGFQQLNGYHKKKQKGKLEMKIIPEMKNSLNELNSRLDIAEERNYNPKTEN